MHFDILEEIDAISSANCVLAPDTCGHNDFILAFKHPSIVSSGYRLGSPILSYQPNRVDGSGPFTVPITTGRLTIIGRRAVQKGDITRAFRDVVHPFNHAAWALSIGLGVVLLVLQLCVFTDFTEWPPRFDVLLFFGDDIIMHERDEVLEVQRRRRRRRGFTGRVQQEHVAASLARRLITIGWIAYFTIFLIFYELALVEAVLNPPSNKLQLSALDSEQVGEFAVRENTATETVFKNIVDKDGKYNMMSDNKTNDNRTTFPWVRVQTAEDIFNKLQEERPSSSSKEARFVRFGLMHQGIAAHMLHENVELCTTLQEYELTSGGHVFQSAFFFTKTVPQTMLNDMNRQISVLQQMAIIQEMYDAYHMKVPEACGPKRTRIDTAFIVVTIALVVGLIGIVVFVLLLWNHVQKVQFQRNSNQVEAESTSFG